MEKLNEHCEKCGKPIYYQRNPYGNLYDEFGYEVPSNAPDWYYHSYGLPKKVCKECENKIRSKWEKDFKEKKVWSDCTRCKGTGKVKGYTCVNCNGKKGNYYKTNVYVGSS